MLLYLWCGLFFYLRQCSTFFSVFSFPFNASSNVFFSFFSHFLNVFIFLILYTKSKDCPLFVYGYALVNLVIFRTTGTYYKYNL